MNDKEIAEIVEVFSDKDIIDDESSDVLRRLKRQYDCISFGKVFLICYDYFSDNIYLIDDEEIKVKIDEYLKKFDAYSLRDCIENYGEGTNWGSYYEGEKIKDIVKQNRDEMKFLINLFFKILGEE